MVYFYNQQKSMIIPILLSGGRSTFSNLNHPVIFRGLEFSLHQKFHPVLLRFMYSLTLTHFSHGVGLKPAVPRHRWNWEMEFSFWDHWALIGRLCYTGSSYGWGGIKLKEYCLGDLELLYTMSTVLKTFIQVKNLGNTSYESAVGYRSPRRAFYVGLSYSF